MGKTITISQEEYESLKDDQFQLEYLESQGVDNWEGYSHPCRKHFPDPNNEYCLLCDEDL